MYWCRLVVYVLTCRQLNNDKDNIGFECTSVARTLCYLHYTYCYSLPAIAPRQPVLQSSIDLELPFVANIEQDLKCIGATAVLIMRLIDQKKSSQIIQIFKAICL